MHGQYRLIGERPTYFPPFVNELFDGPPYWACTFASLLNGVNVGWRGERKADHKEVRALARASGDVNLEGGSRSRHMLRAVRVKYGREMTLRRVTPERAAHRLGSGWALVGAVTYGGLPKPFRRWSPRFTGGHRVVLIGWDEGRTRILDPMADRDESYTGEWIQWSDFEPAWWSGEQLWFREGMFLPQPEYRVAAALPEPRTWRVAAGTTIDFLSPGRAGVVARRVRVDKASEAMFDRIVRLAPAPGSKDTPRTLLRVSSGAFARYLVDAGAPGVKADTSHRPGQAGQPSAAADAHTSAPIDAIRKAKREEYDRIRRFVAENGTLPAPP